MNNPIDHSKLKRFFLTVWKALRPWITFALLILVLRYTGILAALTSATQKAVLFTGILDANPGEYAGHKESFDYNFTVKTLDGKSVDFNTYKGKPIFINLWATWCGPCRAEMPSIQKLYEKVNNDSIAFVMLSIDAEDQLQKVGKFVEAKEFTFPVFMAGDLPPQLQVEIIPTTFVVDKDGMLAYKKAGMADYDTKQFKKFLDKLVVK